jgi:glycosyltransferase involved in cell wall biosynthesis
MVSCINAASKDSRIKEIHVVRYPINEEALFVFSFEENVTVYNRKEYSSKKIKDLAQGIDPDVILCSGWIDKDYLKICKSLKRSAITVLTMDNHWEGSMKQKVLKTLAKITLHKTFSHVWVPGKPQRDYAIKLGFSDRNIHQGFYVIDTPMLSNLYKEKKQKPLFPKVFICVARYIPVKGLEVLWEAFKKLKKVDDTDWELWCVGNGSGFNNRMESDGIHHLGFIQPKDLMEIMNKTGIFVLPSLFEPWGVAVQEFASAGFPLLLSNKVGCAGDYLENEKNGFLFKANNVEDLYQVLRKVINLSEDEYHKMSNRSNELASNFTITNWVDTLVQIGSKGTV